MFNRNGAVLATPGASGQFSHRTGKNVVRLLPFPVAGLLTSSKLVEPRGITLAKRSNKISLLASEAAIKKLSEVSTSALSIRESFGVRQGCDAREMAA